MNNYFPIVAILAALAIIVANSIVSISFFYKHAGLVSANGENWTFHLFPKRLYWIWGRDEFIYDGAHPMYGLGPLFMFIHDEGWNLDLLDEEPEDV